MKKITALILAAFLCFALSPLAFAENSSPNGDTGIIDAEELDSIIEAFAADYQVGTEHFGIGLIYCATGDSYYYNGDSWFYSASLYKVPTCMLLSEKVLAGELAADSVITTSYGSYSVEDLECSSIVYSNNTTGHAVVEYLGGSYSGKCTDQLIKYTRLDESYFTNQDFYDYSYYSPRFMSEVLYTLYQSPDSYPGIVDYMKQAMSGHYFKLGNVEYEIAQKYGALCDNAGRNWNHAAGIIYTPNPIIVTVMTIDIPDWEYFIWDTSTLITKYALSLDERLPEYLAAHEDGEAEENIAQEPAEEIATEPADPAAVPEETNTPVEKPKNDGSADEEKQTLLPGPIIDPEKTDVTPLYFIAGAAGIAIVAVIIAAVLTNNIRKNRFDEKLNEDSSDTEQG